MTMDHQPRERGPREPAYFPFDCRRKHRNSVGGGTYPLLAVSFTSLCLSLYHSPSSSPPLRQHDTSLTRRQVLCIDLQISILA